MELIATVTLRGRATQPDLALARAVRAHIRGASVGTAAVHVRVREGFVFLSGQIDALSRRNRLDDLICGIPGVRNVFAGDLQVVQSGASDAAIRQRALRVLRDTATIDLSTIALAVEQGHVILSGSVSDRAVLDDAVDVLSHVNGVRGIERLTVVSAKQKSQDRQVARRLQLLIERLFPQQNVRVAFFGSVAVLSGVVPALPFKRAAERAILQDPKVSRVVNKIEV